MRARHVRVCAQTGEGLQGISLPRQATAPVTDQAVPEGHKSLHGFLYGDEGADAHRSSRYEFREVTAEATVAVAATPAAEEARPSNNTLPYTPQK